MVGVGEGQSREECANGPDITLRADGTHEKPFAPEHKDTGYWQASRPNEVAYTMVLSMDSRQGQLLGTAAKMFIYPTTTDGQGNYLDASTDRPIGLSATEMRVLEDGGYTYVYRRQ